MASSSSIVLAICIYVFAVQVNATQERHGIQEILDKLEVLERKVELLDNRNAILEKRNAVLENTETILATKVFELNKALEVQQVTIKQLKGKVSPTINDRKRQSVTDLPIAFTARIGVRYVDHVNPGDVIHFPMVLTNQGSAYNVNTSTFTAPIGGTYIITCSLLDHVARSDGTGLMLHADIVKNDVTLARVFAHASGQSYRDQGAQTVLVELQKGDRVWVKNHDSKDLSVGGELYSSFSGYLLWPME